MQMKKSLWIALVTIMLVLSSQLCLVHSRVLRSKVVLTEVADDCVELKESGSSLWRDQFFVVSSENSSTRVSKRSLAFRLASGPSKKGPGH
ncbi:hypothetical protein AAZX31_04G042000 [Glycine max]|uniref:Uncharacterized protein n=2 Tax=Glycine subgen. Soja TaxID=1462606 RepID=C6T1T0_SOYBN|nr:uncharacterized protein LOC100500455 precursor [Glycine max]KHN04466.1 hypothetical protein glysoja_019553 [Glycine soja]ACU15541.1 unknown [Glycine max]KAH1109728.1 hypothetical protein GYH30_008902 [Glycine max]KAH1252503.1 hypothetical protein GmHk_04G009457 [Glycine max]KRH61361.1 hypothetical protein GLYMA_04G043100v4 [Glycine max]|eukprot:NP_001238364.1 uncharacterized protein LOC100500455 precursor [Glycine max]